MRQEHRAGEKMFVDYSGKRPDLVDAATGECTAVELFVAVLGASNYTFAEVTATQQSRDWIGSHTRAREFFGGAPAMLVPDQLNSCVTRSSRYEPEVQRAYAELAAHYDTVVVPRVECAEVDGARDGLGGGHGRLSPARRSRRRRPRGRRGARSAGRAGPSATHRGRRCPWPAPRRGRGP